MSYRILADLVVLLHLLFILFVVAGGLLVLRWKRLTLLHLPAAAWGAFIEFSGWICPLTPLENSFRRMAGREGYAAGFLEHHLLPLIYPAKLTPEIQIFLGLFVILLNLAVYAVVLRRHCQGRAD
jgi:hypothetical protein